MSKQHVICDLDGTLALLDHRRHLVEGPRKQWGAFFDACDQDLPNQPVIDLVGYLASDYHVHILSGRSDRVRDKTTAWLRRHRVPAASLIMRAEGDHTPDEQLKALFSIRLGLTPGNTLVVFDDRDKVVNMWRDRGFTCLQVAPGGF